MVYVQCELPSRAIPHGIPHESRLIRREGRSERHNAAVPSFYSIAKFSYRTAPLRITLSVQVVQFGSRHCQKYEPLKNCHMLRQPSAEARRIENRARMGARSPSDNKIIYLVANPTRFEDHIAARSDNTFAN
jgi:hypothetical protein